MSGVYYSVEYRGACYGSSLHRTEADAALERARARGMTLLTMVERPTRPDVRGWLTPCENVVHGQRRRR